MLHLPSPVPLSASCTARVHSPYKWLHVGALARVMILEWAEQHPTLCGLNTGLLSDLDEAIPEETVAAAKQVRMRMRKPSHLTIVTSKE